MGREVKRRDMYWGNFDPVIGSEQGGVRPCLIINDVGNKYSPTVIVAAITSNIKKDKMPTHYILDTTCGLYTESMVLLEHLRAVDKGRLIEYIDTVSESKMKEIDEAILISLDLIKFKPVYFGGAYESCN